MASPFDAADFPLESADSLVLPELSFPAPGRLHPRWEEIEAGTVDWLLGYGLVSGPTEELKVRNSLFGKALAWMYPVGPVDRILAISHLSIFWFTFDDKIVESTAPGAAQQLAERALHMDQIARSPQRTPPGEDPFHRAYHDIWARFHRWASPRQLLRMQHGMLQAVIACITDSLRTGIPTPPPLALYRPLRFGTSLLSPFVDYNEIVHGIEIPLDTYLQPDVQDLITTGVNLFAIMNDIYSCPRDTQKRQVMNLPAVLAHEHRCSLQEGLDMAAELFRLNTDRFLQLSEELGKRTAEHLPELIEGMQVFTAGILNWYLQDTARYRPANP
ncbi:hypothetical protein [Kitasatospora sp. NPDC093558]|uniref:terpene synthase family protein n=1 Tax=Kitasatospora sp. NPDC093558 TaxID=3155201 RepID=UPI0034152667